MLWSNINRASLSDSSGSSACRWPPSTCTGPTAWFAHAIEQERDVAVEVDAKQGHTEGRTDDAGGLQVLQLNAARIVAHRGDALAAPGTVRQGVEQAAVVQAVA